MISNRSVDFSEKKRVLVPAERLDPKISAFTTLKKIDITKSIKGEL
jgi:hypothetical protein